MSVDSSEECQICFDSTKCISPKDHGLKDCRHFACRDCWTKANGKCFVCRRTLPLNFPPPTPPTPKSFTQKIKGLFERKENVPVPPVRLIVPLHEYIFEQPFMMPIIPSHNIVSNIVGYSSSNTQTSKIVIGYSSSNTQNSNIVIGYSISNTQTE
jgi:hypothetical protein